MTPRICTLLDEIPRPSSVSLLHQYLQRKVGSYRMDLDQILFGLDSFVNECETDTLRADTVFLESYRVLLDQLAVKLRDEEVRSDELIRSNLNKFVDSATYLLLKNDVDGQFRELLLELIRVLANAVADNDFNRKILISNHKFIEQLGNQLEVNFDDDEVNQRVLILLKNMVIDSPDIAKDMARVISQNLFVYLGYENTFMAIDLLTDLIEFYNYQPDFKFIELFIKKTRHFIKNQDSFEEDELSELLVNSSLVLEKITADSRLSFKEKYHEVTTQRLLLEILSELGKLEFPNQLTVQRRIFASIGNVSANLTSSNSPLIEDCLVFIENDSQNNGYIISSSFVILGNSISSAEDRSSILEKSPNLISGVLSKYQYLVDPIQFQGILHILKALISYDTMTEFFLPAENFKIFEQLIEATVRNSRYYTSFTSLLTGFLKKFIVLLGKSQLETINQSSIPKVLLSSESNNETNLILLLYLNKVVIYSSIDEIDEIVKRVLTFKTGNIPLNYLFEITKTVGVLLQHQPNYLLEKHSDDILTLLTTVGTITGEQSRDNAVRAIQNNSRYISGSLINLSKDRPVSQELLNISKELLKDA